jgi:hypothetical protein
MNKVRLEISDDELSDVLTDIWHKSGYSIDKKDPIIIEYMMLKIILRQFEDHMAIMLRHFLDTFLPYIKEADERFEAKKVAFTEYAEGKQKEVLKTIADAYHKDINTTTTKACERILENLQIVIKHWRRPLDVFCGADQAVFPCGRVSLAQIGRLRPYFSKLRNMSACVVICSVFHNIPGRRNNSN